MYGAVWLVQQWLVQQWPVQQLTVGSAVVGAAAVGSGSTAVVGAAAVGSAMISAAEVGVTSGVLYGAVISACACVLYDAPVVHDNYSLFPYHMNLSSWLEARLAIHNSYSVSSRQY
jgi:hypothetical protein